MIIVRVHVVLGLLDLGEETWAVVLPSWEEEQACQPAALN